MSDYSDIIDLEYKKSTKHPHMSNYDRAAQFAPFAALTGFASAINETGRKVDKKIILNDDQRLKIDSMLNIIKDKINENIEVNVVYFIKDTKKDGGKYIRKNGVIRRIDEVTKKLVFKDKEVISIKDILSISSQVLDKYEI